MNENSSSSAATALLAFTSGAVVGAGLALLFAPLSGRETRRKIGEYADDAEENAKEMVHQAGKRIKEAGEKGEEWIGQVKDYVGTKKSELKAAVDGARS